MIRDTRAILHRFLIFHRPCCPEVNLEILPIRHAYDHMLQPRPLHLTQSTEGESLRMVGEELGAEDSRGGRAEKPI